MLNANDHTDSPMLDSSLTGTAVPQPKQVKSGFGGCLLYPLIFLILQPILFIYMLLTERSSPFPNASYRIFWPYMIYDLIMVGAVIVLLLLFFRKKSALPAMFVLFLITIAILSGLLSDIFSRLPAARVTGREPMATHLVILAQCLVLIPYFTLSKRVKNTFTHPFDDRSIVDKIVKPVASPAQRLYNWLVRRGKHVIWLGVVFVILVFLLDWLVDSIVLNMFLR
jgi:hypothetical protein